MKISALLERGSKAVVRSMTALVVLSRSRPWWVLIAAMCLTALSALYVVQHIRIQTNTTDLLFHRSPIQAINRQLEAHFPSLRDRIIVVIDGQTPRRAAVAAQKLAARLREPGNRFETIYVPGAEKFFRENGLLYLSVPALHNLTHQLIVAEPLLGRVATDPSLHGLFKVLNQIVTESSSSNPAARQLPQVFQGIQASLASIGSGKPRYMTWNRLFETGSPTAANRKLIVITLPRGADSPSNARSALNIIRTAAASLHLDPEHGVRIRTTGSIVLNLDQLHAVTSGARISTILSLTLIALILVLGLRSARLLFAVLATLLFGLLWTSAFAVFAIGPFNLISVAFAVLFVGLGVDFSIQFCIRYQEELQHPGGPARAMRATAARMGPPLALAGLAAAASFYSVVPTGYSGIRDLGLIAGTGVLLALVANLTVLPALLAVLRAGRASVPRPPVPFERFPIHRAAMPILVCALALTAGSIYLLPKVSFDFNLAKLQNQHSEAVKTLSSLEKTSPFSPFSIDALAPNLAAADHEAAKVRKLPSVAHVVTLSSFIPDHQAQKLAIIQSTAAVVPPFVLLSPPAASPPGANETCQSMDTLSENLKTFANRHGSGAMAVSAGKLAAGLKAFLLKNGCEPSSLDRLRNLILEPLLYDIHTIAVALQPREISISSIPRDLRRQYLAPDGVSRIAIFSRLNLNRTDALQRFVREVQKDIPYAGGTPVLFVEGGQIVVRAFREATLIAIGLIVLIVFAVLQHLRNVLLTLTPLVLSVLLTIALMVAFHINFNLANIIVIPLTIGLGVAFGIYVIARWRDCEYHITEVLKSSIPEGVLVSGLTTLASFGSLSVSPDPAMASLGETLAIALLLILVNSLIVLPAILAVVERHFIGNGKHARASG